MYISSLKDSHIHIQSLNLSIFDASVNFTKSSTAEVRCKPRDNIKALNLWIQELLRVQSHVYEDYTITGAGPQNFQRGSCDQWLYFFHHNGGSQTRKWPFSTKEGGGQSPTDTPLYGTVFVKRIRDLSSYTCMLLWQRWLIY